MADGAQPQALRYSAFISYSRRDARFARSLHRQLEGYRLPRRGAAHPGSDRAPHARLRPIFRDEEEFCASYDLSGAVREAIAQSDFLIVVCSPNSAASKWVGLEIEDFRAVHGDSRILAALIEGDSSTAFHPALRGSKAITPLAADFRKGAGSHRLSLLKLVAPMAGVGLDDLAQRDAHRRTRRILASGVGGLAATVTIVSLSGLALTARADAERRRTETTGLVEYMLTDMRKTMQRTGRLDQLAALNDGAMQYYRNQDLKRLSEAQLRQRAKLLQAMGEDDEKRGKLEAARESFEDAHRTTAALLAAKPNDPNRIFAHSQSEYWVGFINWRNGDGAAARRHFEEYSALAEQLVATDPIKAEWKQEVAYAATNLGLLAMRQDGDYPRAERHFRAALAVTEAVAAAKPADAGLQSEVATGRAWLADSQRLSGKFTSALENRLAQRRILTALRARDRQNREVRADLLSNDIALARIDADDGNSASAIKRFESVQAEAASLLQTDPDNRLFAKQGRMAELFRVRTLLGAAGAQNQNIPRLDRTLGSCASPVEADVEIATLCMALKARVAALAGDETTARQALASLQPARGAPVLSPRWGLDFRHEIELARNSHKGSR